MPWLFAYYSATVASWFGSALRCNTGIHFFTARYLCHAHRPTLLPRTLPRAFTRCRARCLYLAFFWHSPAVNALVVVCAWRPQFSARDDFVTTSFFAIAFALRVAGRDAHTLEKHGK
jgi:hypothetical protein